MKSIEYNIIKLYLIVVGLFLLHNTLKCHEWKEYRKIINTNFSKITISNRYNKKQLVNSAMKWVIFLTKTKTVCLHRALTAYQLAKIIGCSVNLACGYNILPFTLHVWVEDTDGDEFFNSPYNRAKKMSLNIF